MARRGASGAALALLCAAARAGAQPEDGTIYVNASRSAPARALGTAVGRRLAITSAQQQLIVDKHNTLRAGVTQPCTAADMETLQWDASLAASSDTWAQQCIWAHDPGSNTGENLAMRYSSAGNSVTDSAITWSIQAWYDEVDDTQWTADGNGATSKVYANPQTQCKSYEGPNCMIGHYTQVVWAKTNKIGCAAVVCPSGTLGGSGGFYLVCRYTPAGNWPTSSGNAIRAPWAVGAPCAACASQCSHGSLCDAGVTVNRCADTITTLTVGSTPYTDCATLIAAMPSWCSSQNQGSYALCDRTCGVCSPPANLGLSFCGSSAAPATTTTGGPSQQAATTTASPSQQAPVVGTTTASNAGPTTTAALTTNGAARAALRATAAVACAALTRIA